VIWRVERYGYLFPRRGLTVVVTARPSVHSRAWQSYSVRDSPRKANRKKNKAKTTTTANSSSIGNV
jgi:hypothetical protein